jgi:hypothetical protein
MQVHSHAELAHLLLADVRRTRQLYFELRRDCEIRTFEEATNVKTIVETMLHKNFVLHTCNDVVQEYIQSTHYTIFRKRDDDDDNVVALVCRTGQVDSDRPFKFSRVREIREENKKLLCACASTTVHGRPCRHLIAYNDGVVHPSDFADFHSKKYHAHPYAISAYTGVGNHRTYLSELAPLPPQDSSGGSHDEDNDADNDDNAFDVPAKKVSKARGYHSCAGEFKRLLVKWGNVPRVLQQFERIVREYDDSLGEVETYRCGRPSSKPTPQASRK